MSHHRDPGDTRRWHPVANAPGRELVYSCTSEAAAMLGDLVYTAWLDSAAVPGGSAGVQPINPQHPQYNPATGSAPAKKEGR